MTHMTSERSNIELKKSTPLTGLIAFAAALAALGTGCSVPVQTPAQRPDQTAAQSFVGQLRDVVRRQSAPNIGAPVESDQALRASPLPVVRWPALGAGDFERVTGVMPVVNWSALGAGDFEQGRSAPLPAVNWPALGAGDFEPTK